MVTASAEQPNSFEAAEIELTKWLVLSDADKEFMLTRLCSALSFSNVTTTNGNPLAVSIREYLEADEVLDITTYI